jgi:small-conductance mechanosensitive channel
MSGLTDWLESHWTEIALPLAVFAFSLIALLWLRNIGFSRLEKWRSRVHWLPGDGVKKSLRWPSFIWCLIISIQLGIAVSQQIPAGWKPPMTAGLWTLFVISILLGLASVSDNLLIAYSRKLRLYGRRLTLTRNIYRTVLGVIGILIVLSIWGIPTTPIILVIAIAALAAALAFRDVAPNLYAGYQLNSSREFKPGDFIGISPGEEGYVVEIGPRNTRLQAAEGKILIIPNRRLMQTTVIKFEHALKHSAVPFQFKSRLHIPEITGLKAGNLKELCDILQNAPEPVVYFHTHRFLEEQFRLTPETANDFAIWIRDELGDEALGESLASVDPMTFPSLTALRDRLVGIINEHLETHRAVEAYEGNEFHFMKSFDVEFEIPYTASDLRELSQVLGKVSLSSIYFHMFEARLRLGWGQNDFSLWVEKNLNEPELARAIARIDPYTYTLEGLRLTLIQMCEQSIK